MMDHNIELLQSIYENTTTGKSALSRLIQRCLDANLRQSMADMFAEYHEVQNEAQKLLKAEHINPRSPRLGALKAHMHLNLAIDRTASHMAEMLLHGSLLAIIDIARALREYTAASEESKNLAKRLLTVEETGFKRLQQYL